MSTDHPTLLQVDGAQPEKEPEHRLVAEVLVQTPLPHLDRTFDYAVPDDLLASTHPGVRVKVRFAGTEREGFVIATREPRPGERSLVRLRRVVSDVPALTQEVLAVCRSVAHHYAGTVSDTLRLAIPPRHAAAEQAALQRLHPTAADRDDAPQPQLAAPRIDWRQQQPPAWPSIATDPPLDEEWSPYPGGAAFLRRLAAGDHPRAVWTALPWHRHAQQEAGAGPHWARAVAQAIAATCRSGRSAVAVLPDEGDVHTLAATLDRAGIPHEVLSADQGRSARYRRFVLALTGQVQVVIGTRSAAFAPVPRLGLVVCWDDGDDSLAELRKPYPHARTVLAHRAELSGAGALIGGIARSPHAQMLVRDGWARPLQADRATVRRSTPRIQAPGEVDLDAEGPAGRARIPGIAWRILRTGIDTGPVLVQVPRSGYVPATSCANCRTPARCGTCHGPLRLPQAGGVPACGWCGRLAGNWSCGQCGESRLRANRVGSMRTAEELGRAFPGVPVLVSGRDGGVTGTVDSRPRLVVATPGAEPRADGGYHAAALLDAAVTTERPELDAAVEALRRWMAAAALVRPAPHGQVVLLGQGAPVPSQALVRWDPVGLAERELDERAELDFPPQVYMVALDGTAPAVRRFLRVLHLPTGAEVLGPVEVAATAKLPDDDAEPHPEHGETSPQQTGAAVGSEQIVAQPTVRALVRAPRDLAPQVSAALLHTQAHRSARKEPGTVRIQVDPVRLW